MLRQWNTRLFLLLNSLEYYLLIWLILLSEEKWALHLQKPQLLLCPCFTAQSLYLTDLIHTLHCAARRWHGTHTNQCSLAVMPMTRHTYKQCSLGSYSFLFLLCIALHTNQLRSEWVSFGTLPPLKILIFKECSPFLFDLMLANLSQMFKEI